MSTMATFRPVPGGPVCPGRGQYPPPPFNPSDYWASRKWVVAHLSESFRRVSARLDALERRIEEVEAKGIDEERFNELARKVGLAYLTDVPTVPDGIDDLEGRRFSLDRNEDLYVALAAVIPALGGIVEAS